MGEITDPALLAQLNQTGPDFLKQVRDKDPARANLLQAIGEGREQLPSGFTLRSPYGQQLLSDVSAAYPDFDAANQPARTATYKAFTSGKQSQNISSFNTALGHLQTLASDAEALNNGSYPVINGVENWAERNLGDPRVTNFNVAKQAVADELERAFKGASGTVFDKKGWEDTLSSANSPAQLRGAISQAADLLNSRIGALRDSYNNGMKTTDQELPFLNPHAVAALTALTGEDYKNKGLSAIAAPAPDNGTPPSGNAPSGPPGSPPPGNGPTSPVEPAAPQGTVATGDTHTEIDAQKSAQLEALIRSNAPMEEIQKVAPGTDPAQVAAVRAYLVKHPNYSGFAQVTQEAPNTILNKIAGSAPAAAIAGAADAATFGLGNKAIAGATALGDRLSGDNRSVSDIYNDNLARAEIGSNALAAEHPIANLAGETAGFIGGDAALGRGLKAGIGTLPTSVQALGGKLLPQAIRPALQDAAYGAAYGAGSSDSLSDAPGDALKGAGMAALGGALGRGVTRGVAALASPVANASVRRLTDAGVTLTPGQILGVNDGLVGRAVKGVEDRAAGFPVVGDIINNARRGGVEDFNRAAINDALAPIGEQAADIGHAGVADAQQKVSDAYTAALAKMKAVPDAQFTADLKATGSKVGTLSQDYRERFNNIVDTDVQPYINGRSALDGNDLQAIKQGLDKRIGNLTQPGASPQDRELADRLGEVRDSVLDLAGRTPGSDTTDFQNANRAYAALSRVEGAAAKSKDGVFSPNQFRQAVTKRGYGTTTKNVATGSARGQQLATDASLVLPNAVPDSGTAGRAALGILGARLAPGAALGGAAGGYEGGTGGALTGAALGAAAFSRPGLRATQAVLAGSRGKTLNTLGDILRRNAALGGAIGTPLLLSGSRNGN